MLRKLLHCVLVTLGRRPICAYHVSDTCRFTPTPDWAGCTNTQRQNSATAGVRLWLVRYVTYVGCRKKRCRETTHNTKGIGLPGLGGLVPVGGACDSLPHLITDDGLE